MGVTAADVAGPGFNLRLANDVWQALIGQVLNMGQQYGTSSMESAKRSMLNTSAPILRVLARRAHAWQLETPWPGFFLQVMM